MGVVFHAYLILGVTQDPLRLGSLLRKMSSVSYKRLCFFPKPTQLFILFWNCIFLVVLIFFKKLSWTDVSILSLSSLRWKTRYCSKLSLVLKEREQCHKKPSFSSYDFNLYYSCSGEVSIKSMKFTQICLGNQPAICTEYVGKPLIAF